MIYERPLYRVMGDRALLLELGDEISPTVNGRVRELFLELDRRRIPGIKEIVPGYSSLMVVYDPLTLPFSLLQKALSGVMNELKIPVVSEPKTLKIPVLYGGERGPDLEWVAAYCGISPDEVIRLHSGTTYQVYMIGFTPGYPYMGEVPEEITIPRRETPRTLVPRGSVAIAQKQTGIYPVDSPGGWHVIGWTPLNLFDPCKTPPSLLEMGDRVEFFSIAEQEVPRWQA